MAVDQISRHGANALIFSITKALHKSVGGNTAAVLRQASADMLKEFSAIGITDLDSSDISVLRDSVRKLFIDLDFCEDISFEEQTDSWKMHVQGCCFWELTQHLKEEGIPPFACPYAGLVIALAEINLGVRARVKEIVPDNDRGSHIHISFQ